MKKGVSFRVIEFAMLETITVMTIENKDKTLDGFFVHVWFRNNWLRCSRLAVAFLQRICLPSETTTYSTHVYHVVIVVASETNSLKSFHLWLFFLKPPPYP